ncbi:MAG TPA: N-6 DNA methylase, partial [Ktedonobacteraceae bacterium]|nr:N-6 DNA methylase [Ktedonobacteraceae bacterium]
MTEPVQLQLVGAKHSNQRLFSDHYLDHILPELIQGGQDVRNEAAQVMAQLRRLYDGFTPNASNEAQTEEDWIRPVLRALGHSFEVQVPLKVPDGVQRPDYIFYRDGGALAANKSRIVDAEMLQAGAYAIGDAKSWDRPLDKALESSHRGGDAFSNKNPSYQIFFYMLHSGLPWGILTNGRKWRLYSARSAHRLDVFYEVDLPALLEADVDSFCYFYIFFRREAFESGPLALDSILQASTEFAQEISDNLREQVYSALRYVAQGFFEYRANGLTPSPETNKAIYDNSLILLYRLLFILYAEARDLLPLQENTSYRRLYSLEAIKKEVVSTLHAGLILPDTGLFWTRLKELFKIINQGSPPLTVTTFNGGLFDPARHPFLERYTVGDVCLCRAIDELARVKNQFVDYRDLSERHLGTIYEGLLEYNTIFVAEEPMVERRSTSKIVPARDVPKKDVAQQFATGEVYLVNDRGERKLTGSYYTPDFIVKYMVDEAIRPALDAAIAGAQSDEERISAVLSVNVLDPSMGSGHFPVEVTEYIARYLVELGIRADEDKETDLVYWKRRVAQQCIYGVDLNPLAVELAKLSLWLSTAAKDHPLSFLDHHLRAGNALIGAWLEDVAAGQNPATLRAQRRTKERVEAQREAGQMTIALFDEAFRQTTQDALASIAAIEQNPGVTITDVKAQEAAYDTLRRIFIEKYRRLANLGTALYYNLNVGADSWHPLADYVLGKIEQPSSPQFDTWSEAAETLAERKHFFHWELEFPNIFFDSQGQSLGERAGFDVVIGNPPYVRQEQLGQDKPFYAEHYEVYHGVADLFVYFFAQGLRLLRAGGRLAYISSNSWLRANYATPLRQYLRTKTTIETIVDLGDNRVFADAPDMTPAIQIVQKTPPSDGQTAQAAIFGRGEGIASFRARLDDKLFAFSVFDQADTGWQLTIDDSRNLFAKLMASGRPLKEEIDRGMYNGVKTGLNEAFIIDQATRDRIITEDPFSKSVIKPILRGEDLRPWYQENEGRWLICLPNGWTRQTFPDLYQNNENLAWEKLSSKHPGLASYLKPFASVASKRQDKGQYWWELRPCDYYDAFENPKIFWPDIARFPRFSWDEQGQFVNDKGFLVLPNDISLLGILQSRVCWFCITQICASLGERAGSNRYQQKMHFISRLPIPSLTDEQRECIGSLAQQLTETAKQRYEVRRRMTHRIVGDLGTAAGKLNQRLDEWWQLSFREFREELQKAFKRDIPLRERDEWEALLREQTGEIGRL